jgi:hypothetical protein
VLAGLQDAATGNAHIKRSLVPGAGLNFEVTPPILSAEFVEGSTADRVLATAPKDGKWGQRI